MKQFILNIWYRIEDTLISIQTLSSLMKQLNIQVFKFTPITYLDLYEWCQLFGTRKVIADLKEMLDKQSEINLNDTYHYKQETN